jgi:hypothetical protein
MRGTHTDPFEVRVRVESAEAAHFWATVLFLPYIVVALWNGLWSVVVWFALAQALVNVYPLLHLR